jgi:uncharacterized phage protein (TIGR01671 family)
MVGGCRNGIGAMRDIKFRAWHTELKRMFSAEEMGKDELTLSVDGRGFVNVNSISTILSQYVGEKMIPMQYIGLKDRHSVEIYEGDILDTAPHMNKEEVIKQWGHYVYYEVVEYREFHYAPFDYENGPLGEECLVVGNIYENPELLKKGDRE